MIKLRMRAISKFMVLTVFVCSLLLLSHPCFASTLTSQITEIYVATFGRAPDYNGLMYWVGTVEDGLLTVEEVATNFFSQDETAAKYVPGTSNSEFITTIYQNTLNRDPDASGLAYWMSELDRGAIRRDQAIVAIIYGAKASSGSATDRATLSNKTAVGEYFAHSMAYTGLRATEILSYATDIMMNVTSDPATVNSAYVWIDDLLDSIEQSGSAGAISWQEIYYLYKDSTVLVTTYYANGQVSLGSGFFIDIDVIVTCNHVVDGQVSRIEIVLSNSESIDVIGIDQSLANRDIAFLEVPHQIVEPIILGEFDWVLILDEIMHIGNPQQLLWTANRGYVSAIRTAGDVDGLNWVAPDTKIIQHDISSDHGSSGGVILNEFGEAIAILFAGLDGVSGEFRFGISIDYVSDYIDNLVFTPLAESPTYDDNYQKTEMLRGQWMLTYQLTSIWTDIFYLNGEIFESSSKSDQYYIAGENQYGDYVLGGYTPTLNKWALLDTSYSTYDFFYYFNTDGNQVLPGSCLYLVDKLTDDLSSCYALTGYKLSYSLITYMSEDMMSKDDSFVEKTFEANSIGESDESVDEEVFDSYLEIEKQLNN